MNINKSLFHIIIFPILFFVSPTFAKTVKFKYTSRLANQGEIDAQNDLGWMYENGQGVVQNYEKAFECYSKAAAQDCAVAQANLGMMYQLNGMLRQLLRIML
ncbi:tetratricopeptide repeat protein [Acinetobacter guillouiae]|uniref:tetratricopeptide repeat protein n=1 Tax=Acinetobacter guillouiae TaxID=106649 RepID=UPI003340981F